MSNAIDRQVLGALRFRAWMKQVDAAIAAKVGGLTSDDLPDLNYAEMFDDGVKPKSAANRAIKNAGN